MRKIYFFFVALLYSFPVQLLLNNLRRNHVLMLCWVVLWAMVTGNFGKYLGIPYLFLDPEYMNRVDFTSFFIMGLITASFVIAYHITCYITDGHRFSFIGALPRPFTKFMINNSTIPLLFIGIYVYQIVQFQVSNQYSSPSVLAMDLTGLFSGYLTMSLLFYIYFRSTNKDIFKYVVCRIDEKLKQNVQITRASAMEKLDIARKRQIRVDFYLDNYFRVKKVDSSGFYDRATIIQVFDQNHFNLVVIELLIFVFVLVLGLFKDHPAFQLPAASSFMLFLTIFVMMAGAFAYWFSSWSATVALALFLILNYLMGTGFFSRRYEAFGLDYLSPPATYTIPQLRSLNDSIALAEDRKAMTQTLQTWRKKFPEGEKPKMVFLCVSGGGKRAALWALKSLQTVDSVTQGGLMKNTVLITGASGGLIGAAYFRELKLRQLTQGDINPYSPKHIDNISRDNLNPLIFSLLANDLFMGFSKFSYSGYDYRRDRGYTFEEQLNQNTDGMLDKSISAYAQPEADALVPIMVLAPTIVNDGRKLYIASHPMSFLNGDFYSEQSHTSPKISGVDFNRLFAGHGGNNLRFLSALRMSATFPYITPNTTLPTEPPIQIMDAGISDNFGLIDAFRFFYAFHEWIEENTSGVVFVSIRDSPKLETVYAQRYQTLMDDLIQPISSVYNNFENFQDINSDLLISQGHSWFSAPIDRIDIEYQAGDYIEMLQHMDSIRQNSTRASLSWRLTAREKQSIVGNIGSERNMKAIQKLSNLLKGE